MGLINLQSMNELAGQAELLAWWRGACTTQASERPSGICLPAWGHMPPDAK